MKPYNINIYLGLREGYEGIEHHITEVIECLEEYCESNPFCFSVTPTTYVHAKGTECGAIIGIINYPRFPKKPTILRNIALDVAAALKERFKQIRVTIGTPDEMIMLGEA